jgi:jouberin
MKPDASTILQHTNFVYACIYHPKVSTERIVITGAYDGQIRIWDLVKIQVLVILKEHNAPINSLTICPNGSRFFSADSKGVIKIWEDTNYTRSKQQQANDQENAATKSITGLMTEIGMSHKYVSHHIDNSWSTRFRCYHTIHDSNLIDQSITCIRYHPRPERFIAYVRNNSAYLFSLLRYDIRQTLAGIPCRTHNLRCCISPDGELFVAGGEDGKAYFYELKSGSCIDVLDIGYHLPMYDITWHPNQHCVAFAAFGGDVPIFIYEYKTKLEKLYKGTLTKQSLFKKHNVQRIDHKLYKINLLYQNQMLECQVHMFVLDLELDPSLDQFYLVSISINHNQIEK